MADRVVIYHNPKCSKSRETLKLLEDRGVEPEVVKYLEAPLSKTQLASLLAALALPARALLRSKEAAYREACLSEDSTQDEILAAIVEYPILLERPIVVRGKKAVIGRPPENVLTIL